MRPTTLKGRYPAINADKTEIEFLVGGDSILCDDLKGWAIDERR